MSSFCPSTEPAQHEFCSDCQSSPCLQSAAAAAALCYLSAPSPPPPSLCCPLGSRPYLVHIVPARSSDLRAHARLGVGCRLYLGVEWRRQISELCDVCLERSQAVFVTQRTIAALQAVVPLGLRYGQVAVAGRRWKEGGRAGGGGEPCEIRRSHHTHACERANKKKKKREKIVYSAHLRVSPGGPASSGCCSCC